MNLKTQEIMISTLGVFNNFKFRISIFFSKYLILLFFLSLCYQSQSQSPFNCPSTFFQNINGQLRVFNPITGDYTSLGANNEDFNAGGYNVVDGFLYAIFRESTTLEGHLIRIASDR